MVNIKFIISIYIRIKRLMFAAVMSNKNFTSALIEPTLHIHQHRMVLIQHQPFHR